MRARRQLWLVLLSLPFMNGRPHPVTAGDGPDTSKILRLASHWTSAQACPVDGRVLTARHVAEKGPYRWSDGLGHEGIVETDRTDRCADLAWMKLRSGSPTYYTLAKKAPSVGDPVWLLGFDTSSRAKAFGPKVFDSRVVRVLAGHLILSSAGKAGSSGSCVLNAEGEVVGINSGGNLLDGGETEIVGRVVGIYGDWLDSCREGS